MYLKRNDMLEVLKLYLGDYNKQFYLREISRLTKLPLKTTQNVANALERSKILKTNISGKNKYFKLNLDNIQTKLYLLQAEGYKTIIFLEKYQQFKTFLKEISKTTIIIFGSFAKFNPEKDSDLDLLIISQKEEKLPAHLIPHKIHDIKITKKAFAKSVKNHETFIKEVEENHIILNNHSFYVDLMWDHYGKQT